MILGTRRNAEAQRDRKEPRIGILQTGTRAAVSHMVDAIRDGLRDHGWLEGKNLTMEYRFGPERLPESAAELVKLNVDVIVTGATPVTVAGNVLESIRRGRAIIGRDASSDRRRAR